MQKKIVHEVKLQKSVIVALYLLTAGVFLVAAKPMITPAVAQLNPGDSLNVAITGWYGSGYSSSRPLHVRIRD